MKVLWATQVYPRRSGDILGSFLHRLARGLPERNVVVEVLAPAADGLPSEETIDGVKVRRFRYAPEGEGRIAYTGEMHRAARRNPAQFLAFLRAFRSAVRGTLAADRFDVVHSHWWAPPGLLAGPAARRHGAKHVISLHGTDVRLVDRLPFGRRAAQRVLGKADLLLPVSRHLARAIEPWRGDTPVEVLPMPADGEQFRPGTHERRGVLAVARLTTQKQIDHAVEAVAVLRKRGTHVPFTIVGDGPERRPLESLAARRGVGDLVSFTGECTGEDLVAHYQRGRALVVPSDREGYGLVVIEAGLCETPTVGVRSGALEELIDDGTTGWLAPLGDVEALADGIAAAVADGAEAARRGAAARERALAGTTGPLAERLVDLYARLARP